MVCRTSLHRDSGQEVVYSMETGEIVPDNSTYNYGSQTNWFNSYYEGIHRVYDVSTHDQWLESKERYESRLAGRLVVAGEEESVERAVEAMEDALFIERMEMAKQQMQSAREGHLTKSGGR